MNKVDMVSALEEFKSVGGSSLCPMLSQKEGRWTVTRPRGRSSVESSQARYKGEWHLTWIRKGATVGQVKLIIVTTQI